MEPEMGEIGLLRGGESLIASFSGQDWQTFWKEPETK